MCKISAITRRKYFMYLYFNALQHLFQKLKPTISFLYIPYISYLLYMNEEIKELFIPGLMVSYKSSRKLSMYLVTAKVRPLKRSTESKKCNIVR